MLGQKGFRESRCNLRGIALTSNMQCSEGKICGRCDKLKWSMNPPLCIRVHLKDHCKMFFPSECRSLPQRKSVLILLETF